ADAGVFRSGIRAGRVGRTRVSAGVERAIRFALGELHGDSTRPGREAARNIGVAATPATAPARRSSDASAYYSIFDRPAGTRASAGVDLLFLVVHYLLICLRVAPPPIRDHQSLRIFFSFRGFLLWGRLVTCGRLAIGLRLDQKELVDHEYAPEM